MVRSLLLVVALPLLGGSVMAATYRVTHTGDSGSGSLRRAIVNANRHAGEDTIEFDLPAESTINPLTPLPSVEDNHTHIDGGVSRERGPNVTIDGTGLRRGSGLFVEGDGCVVENLAVVNFPFYGIALNETIECSIRRCHVGVDRTGTVRQSNGEADIALLGAATNVIGGSSRGEGNLVGGGDAVTEAYGILMDSSNSNTIIGNTFGLAIDRKTSLGQGAYGIAMGLNGPCNGNRIGGTTAAERNVLGSLAYGIAMKQSSGNSIRGNYIGVAGNGRSVPTPRGQIGIAVSEGSSGNRIGGTQPGARNVFAGLSYGLVFINANNAGNRVLGNYFGLTAAGTAQRFLAIGVAVGEGSAKQIIGGTSPAAANYFAPKSPKAAIGAYVVKGGAGTLVTGNKFGCLGDGSPAEPITGAIYLDDAPLVRVTGNDIERAQKGISVRGSKSVAHVYNNQFRSCGRAVMVASKARCSLGNLGNKRAGDDGGNEFKKGNRWYIYNATPNNIKAEGNIFPTTSAAQINAKIHDKRDDPIRGLVDFSPLMGGVIPTGETDAPLALTGLAALPSPTGAEVAFTLSSAARVQARILSIAGRPVRTLCHAKDSEAGTNALLWDAQSDQGLPVPNGTYLVEVMAKAADGSQTRALTQVQLNR